MLDLGRTCLRRTRLGVAILMLWQVAVLQLSQQLPASKTRIRRLSRSAAWLHRLVKLANASPQYVLTNYQSADTLTRGLSAYVCEAARRSSACNYVMVCSRPFMGFVPSEEVVQQVNDIICLLWIVSHAVLYVTTFGSRTITSLAPCVHVAEHVFTQECWRQTIMSLAPCVHVAEHVFTQESWCQESEQTNFLFRACCDYVMYVYLACICNSIAIYSGWPDLISACPQAQSLAWCTGLSIFVFFRPGFGLPPCCVQMDPRMLLQN